MKAKYEDFPSNLERSLLPIPPPLPAHFNTRFQQKGTKSKKYCCVPVNASYNSWDRLFDEGYRSDVSISMNDGTVIYAHASVLGFASPIFKSILRQSKSRGRHHSRKISIHGAPPAAVRVFIRFLYSSCYEEEKMRKFAMPLFALSHAYATPKLKRLCESWLEQRLITTENAIDIFQLALLCDAPRLSLISHRFILSNFKSVSASEGWKVMKLSHPVLETELLESVILEEVKHDERIKKANERDIYVQLYEAMEALVHICKDGCRTIGPRDKTLRDDKPPCQYIACKGLETLIRHFRECKTRGHGGSCTHCKRMWQLLELHSWLCANSDACKVPLCENFRQRREKQTKKEDTRWRILVKKVVRSSSISGAPFFSLEAA